MKQPPSNTTLELRPIGHLRSIKVVKFQTRHQASEAPPEQNLLEFEDWGDFKQASLDLEGFSRIWLLWWFHRHYTWRPLVLPPRGPAQRRGVFATRSPHRPNALGLSCVELLAVEPNRLVLGPCDLLDGTPIFDIKPYVAKYDAFPEARAGWIDEADAWQDKGAQFNIAFSELARTQADWLRNEWNVDFTPRLLELLALDPTPHRSRRIRPRGDTQFEIGCGAWRAVFEVQGQEVLIVALEAGYARRYLLDPKRSGIPDLAAQLAHLERWPDQPDRAR